MRREWFARILIVALIAAAVAIPLVARWLQSQNLVLHARIPEQGGWLPENLKAEMGRPLHLYLTSDDVVHGSGLGKSDLAPVDIHPGEVTEVTLTFDKPGTYTFYCTRWCSINHWRMRGVIEVSDPNHAASDSAPETPVKPPLYVTLGLDIDAGHRAEAAPERLPSAARGAQLGAPVPAVFQARQYYLTHSPVELWKALRAEPGLQPYDEQQVWDLVAWVWSKNSSPADLEQGRMLYAQNCAACHGETGRGDGVYADALAANGSAANALASPQGAPHAGMSGGSTGGGATMSEMTTQTTDFTDPEHMLAASPAHLQGKILRGGMGTGMPSWGPIFTEHQTWAIVAYLWTFQFQMEQ